VDSLSKYIFDPALLQNRRFLFVVKSLDQTVRRQRMIESLGSGRKGRSESRPTAEGLLVRGMLSGNSLVVENEMRYKEPRHIIKLEAGYALSTVNAVHILDNDLVITRSLTHKFFAFLHSVALSHDNKRILVTSSGYDSIIEIELDSGRETFIWHAWENGFNPDERGNWLTTVPETFRRLKESGMSPIFIDPVKYGEQGINTLFRTAHPNVAVYDYFYSKPTLVVSIGHGGRLGRIDLETGDFSDLNLGLSTMPHGLRADGNGWYISNTTAGELWILDSKFEVTKIIDFKALPKRYPEAAAYEWLQNSVRVDHDTFLCIDSNRGLLAVDIVGKRYNIFLAPDEWCVQDLLPLD
jgi:hypothetical protein